MKLTPEIKAQFVKFLADGSKSYREFLEFIKKEYDVVVSKARLSQIKKQLTQKDTDGSN